MIYKVLYTLSDIVGGLVEKPRKRILWVGNARKDLAELPDAIKENVGHQLWLLQNGQMPVDFKPMSTVGNGVYEIRVPDSDGRNVGRCFYVARVEEGIAVLHSFVKTSQQTSKGDIEKGKARFKALNEYLKKNGGNA